jgi:hypothetical protein
MVWNQRVLQNDVGIVFPASAQTETLRFWLPFTETDGPYSIGHDVLNQCNSMSFGGVGGCCTCSNLNNVRYGNAGVVDTSSNAQDVGMWLPHLLRPGGFSMAFVHQAPGDAYLLGGGQVWTNSGPTLAPFLFCWRGVWRGFSVLFMFLFTSRNYTLSPSLELAGVAPDLPLLDAAQARGIATSWNRPADPAASFPVQSR